MNDPPPATVERLIARHASPLLTFIAAAGVLTVNHLRFRRQQFGNAVSQGYGLCDEAIGGGDHRQLMSAGAMRFDQVQGLVTDERPNPRFDVVASPGRELFHAVSREGS